ncbi:MAG TPA: dienelactone hydrolase family protein [Balneolales bacterium]|nr:dienelactone hydrolase family protein [Balneolales bacterium]
MRSSAVIMFISIFLISVLMITGCKSKKNSYTEKVAQEHKNDTPSPNAASLMEASQPVNTEDVVYATVNGKKIKGYYAAPESSDDSLPGMIVIHEWWGLNDNIRAMTRRIAGEGYKALAVDLYNGQTADKPDGAMKLMQKAMDKQQAGIENLKQAFRYLKNDKHAGKTGVIGWCFGGGWSLQTALALPDSIDATAIYYGHLVTDTNKLETLQMPVIGFFGGLDKSISQETINKFKSTLDSLGKQVQIKVYPDANHAFANPSGTRYNAKAASDAWKRTMTFFDKYLKS